MPGIAVSLNSFHPPFHFAPVASLIADNLDELLGLWDENHFINVNAPNLVEPRGVEVTSPAPRRYEDHLLPFEPPRGGTYYFVDGQPAKTEVVAGTDWHAVEHGKIAVSPVLLDPVNHEIESKYRELSFVTDR